MWKSLGRVSYWGKYTKLNNVEEGEVKLNFSKGKILKRR